jgi:hypothetical protein
MSSCKAEIESTGLDAKADKERPGAGVETMGSETIFPVCNDKALACFMASASASVSTSSSSLLSEDKVAARMSFPVVKRICNERCQPLQNRDELLATPLTTSKWKHTHVPT